MNLSKVTSGTYCQVHNANGKNAVESATGWYVGGLIQEGSYGEGLTVHLLQPDGEIIGVNMSGGFYKQFKRGNELTAALGKFVRLFRGEAITTKSGMTFVPVEVATPPAPSDMPPIDFEIIHAFNLAQAKKNGSAGASGPAPTIFSGALDNAGDSNSNASQAPTINTDDENLFG